MIMYSVDLLWKTLVQDSHDHRFSRLLGINLNQNPVLDFILLQ